MVIRQMLRPLWLVCMLLAQVSACGETPAGAGGGTRSPTLDYREEPRGGDGEVLGAEQQSPGDWLAGERTNLHPAYNSSLEEAKPRLGGDAGAAR